MSVNKKVLLIITLLLGVLTFATIVNVAINFYEFGRNSTEKRAHSIAESVRDSLTSHMVNGTMEKRYMFLNNMMRHQEVQNLRVLRAKNVIEQFGMGNVDVYEYDDIEKQVMREAQSVTKVYRNDTGLMMRVTIPYVASKYSNPDCLSCHTNVKEGDVLGVISMDLDISDVRMESMMVILRIIAITVLFFLLALFIANRYIRPYIKLFDDLEEGISRAYRGDFSHYVSTELSNEAGDVAERLNELSEIFRFKKTIERDADKHSIYKRLAYILEHSFGISSFVIMEVDVAKKERNIIYTTKKEWSEGIHAKDAQSCRAFRTGSLVCSTDFPNICETCHKQGTEFLCIPLGINDAYEVLVHIEVPNVDELGRIRALMPIITNYFEVAKPVLESKLLMDILTRSTLIDPMTELYNRRFLEDFIDIKLMEKDRQFAILMIDVDYFKQVNDTFGHDVGDTVLKALAELLKSEIKGSDLAIRFGGEEFMVLLFDVNEENAERIANNLRINFSKKHFLANEQSFSKTLSVGIALYPEHIDTPWHAIKFADVALYEAKNSGRNRVVVYREGMYNEAEF